MKFNSVTPVILGFLSFDPMSGYEIKQRVDGSTRFFWAASYGQIYPELRRLATAGLVEGESSPRGGRQRNVYTLTSAGRASLVEWLAAPSVGHELRGILENATWISNFSSTDTLASLRRFRSAARRSAYFAISALHLLSRCTWDFFAMTLACRRRVR